MTMVGRAIGLIVLCFLAGLLLSNRASARAAF
jgi:hypothetical protein